jgi:hypothetical protein
VCPRISAIQTAPQALEVSVPVDILAIINLLFPLVHRVVVDTSADYFH